MLRQLAEAKTLRGGKLVVTPTLSGVVSGFCQSLTSALNDEMIDNAGTCFLLVGKKGTGKSSLLAALGGKEGAMAQAVGGRRVITLNLDMDNRRLPHPVRRLELKLDFQTPALSEEEKEDDPEAVRAALLAANAKLTTENKALVLLLDEYQAVYREEHGICGAWRDLMHAIPNLKYNQERRIFAIVSGSSAWLRALAFCHAEIGTVPKKFAGYTTSSAHQSLNHQKYACTYLDNFTLADCKTVLTVWGMADRLEEVYFHTGGVPRLMEHYVKSHEDYPYTKAKLAAPTAAGVLLRTMATMLDEHLQQTRTATLTSECLMHKLAFFDVLERMENDGSSLTLAQEYSAADNGQVCFSDGELYVTFTAPILAAYMIQVVRTPSLPWLTPHLRLALAFPYGVLGIEAEEALRRCVAERVLGAEPASYRNDAVFRHTVSRSGKGWAKGEGWWSCDFSWRGNGAV